MNLNKFRKKHLKFNYDGKRIVQIGKKELYFFVYKRIWDLTKYNSELLEKYDLLKATYIYIGQSNKYNLKARCSDWRYELEKCRDNVAINTLVFIKNLSRFLKKETNLKESEIRQMLYYNAEILERHYTKSDAIRCEQEYNSNYYWNDIMGEILDSHTILLSKKDSNCKEIKDGALRILQYKIN